MDRSALPLILCAVGDPRTAGIRAPINIDRYTICSHAMVRLFLRSFPSLDLSPTQAPQSRLRKYTQDSIREINAQHVCFPPSSLQARMIIVQRLRGTIFQKIPVMLLCIAIGDCSALNAEVF